MMKRTYTLPLSFHVLLLLLLGLHFSCSYESTPNSQSTRGIKSLTSSYELIDIPTSTVTINSEKIPIEGFRLTQNPYGVQIEFGNSYNWIIHLNEENRPSGRISGDLNTKEFDISAVEIATEIEKNTQLPYIYHIDFSIEENTIEIDLSPFQGSLGNLSVEVDENEAILNGVLGYQSWNEILELNNNFPEVNTLVLVDMPGSSADEINLKIGYLIREAGYTTKALPSSNIASGGVDFFIAGKKRIIPKEWESDENGFFVHSWCCTASGVEPADLPRNAQVHQKYIDYSNDMLGEGIGEEFYFYTLNAAGTQDPLHRMTDEELIQYDIGTDNGGDF